ncbi:hypothetical protein GINT2_000088 [Glugoides intestinalis]
MNEIEKSAKARTRKLQEREAISEDPKKFGQKLEKENMLIIAAIKKYGTEALLEDKTLDMITSIIYKRLKSNLDVNTDARNSVPAKSESASGAFLKLQIFLGLIVSLVYLYKVSTDKSSYTQEGSPTSEGETTSIEKNKVTNVIKAGKFEFKPASQVSFKKYFGRKSEFEKVLSYIKRFIIELKNLSREELDDINAYNKLNFLLEGPPGTGKTVFVHYLSGAVDRYLKLKYLQENAPEDYKKLSSSNEELEKYLETAESRLYFCEVSPGALNSKWYGESEKNIHKLFDTAKKIADIESSAAFIFFDEGDVFFSKRDGDSHSAHLSSGIKSELLQLIGVRPNDKYRPVFNFCATNRFEVFDDAFKRRFGNQLKFYAPNTSERRDFIQSLFESFGLTQKELDCLVQMTKGRTQSFISRYMKDFYVEDDFSRVIGFSLRKYICFLRDMLDDINIV